jgi:hypothetical protein
MSGHCEIIEVRNLADAVGVACPRSANSECSSCGAELCESHAETCGLCRAVFCQVCLSFHQTEHSKPEGRAMPKRDLRVVKRAPIALGICERCNLQFTSDQPAEDDAEAELWAQFDNHKCRYVGVQSEHSKPASADRGQGSERKTA